NFNDLLIFQSFIFEHVIGVQTFNISVLVDTLKARVGHPKFLTLKNIRCTLQAMQGDRKHLGTSQTVLFSIILAEPGHDSRLIMVAPEYRIPAVTVINAEDRKSV